MVTRRRLSLPPQNSQVDDLARGIDGDDSQVPVRTDAADHGDATAVQRWSDDAIARAARIQQQLLFDPSAKNRVLHILAIQVVCPHFIQRMTRQYIISITDLLWD